MHLGQALYKVCNHLQIVPKVGVDTFWLTLLNMLFIRLATLLVTMPRTMTQCFKSLHAAISSRQVPLLMWNTTTLGLSQAFDLMWCTHAFSFRCLAHIINLATQAVITTCSKAEYYDGSSQDDNELPEDLGATERDEIGIVRAICIKVHHSWFQSHRIHVWLMSMKACSSTQHKEAFRAIQYRCSVPLVQVLLDMKVWWSSTFVMLSHAESQWEVCILKFVIVFLPTQAVISQAVDQFILELGLKGNSSEKQHKITVLALNDEEWTCIGLFCNILHVRLLSSFNTTTDAWPYSACKWCSPSILICINSEPP